MQTVDIKGKSYVMVHDRILFFRENYPNHSLVSEIVELKEGRCVIKASILDADKVVVATGHAYEMEGSTFINKTSYIENCETSAWGRALGNLGVGIDASIASAEEVANAIKQQEAPKKGKVAQEKFAAERCTEEQVQDLYGEGEKLGMTNAEVNTMAGWYKNKKKLGVQMTKDGAKSLITDFPTEYALWTAAQMEPVRNAQEEDVEY